MTNGFLRNIGEIYTIEQWSALPDKPAAAASIFILSDEASILMCAWRTSVVVEEDVQRPLLSVAEPRGAPSRTGRTTIALLSDYSVL